MRHEIETALVRTLEEESDARFRSVLIVTFCRLVHEHLSLLHALLVVDGFSRSGIGVDASAQGSRNRLIGDLVKHQRPRAMLMPELAPPPGAKQRLKKSLRSPGFRLANLVRSGFSQPKFLFKEAHIATEIARHRRAAVRPVDETTFFFPDGRGRDRVGDKDVRRLAEVLSERVTQVFESRGVSVSDGVSTHLAEYHELLFRRTHAFLQDAEASTRRYEAEIWAGSGQNYFVRLLAEAGRSGGSSVTCFEHGEAKAIYRSSVNSYGELGCCDTFVTYTKRCADLYQSQLDATSNLRNEIPRIEVSEVGTGTSYLARLRAHGPAEIATHSRSVMYVPGAFVNDLIYYAWKPHDMIYLEWQAWLLEQVLSMGYSVSAKYHPEGLLCGRAPAEIEGVSILEGFFQDHTERRDILLFDTTGSTALQIALCTPNPIVLIDYPASEVPDTLKDELRGRVELVEGFMDERNRLRVSPTRLESALQESSRGKNYDFVRDYLVPF